ncbi:hypothetical protein SAMN05421823_11179 [Catalinimonas alkaloidigena]|uniref:Polyketide cyclase / dehydrase and lipid transport n=1 Tax=Catalinimonas alkaloidigena TaxID=1075417 RepID=A0A1G9RA55_9BACT|nr:hypothetical protein [Catalinimonas alkaloidigena]SDM19747.1 hypothetical protein SAMN05421823_11179 [Catalinimonas alkaloidigena]
MRKILVWPRPVFLTSLGIGVTYGLMARLIFGLRLVQDYFEVMSTTFIFLVPVVVGFLAVYLAPPEDTSRFRSWVTLPWTACFLTVFTTLLLAWEGIICIIVWLPVLMLMSSLGGVGAGMLKRKTDHTHTPGLILPAVALLPFVLAPLEQQLAPPLMYRTAHTSILIRSTPDKIWPYIKEVAPITSAEQGFSWAHLIGFPKPIEARLEGNGVGAIRYATFEGGVLFIESVTAWEPDHFLSFTIQPDPYIPPTTFDEHVVVGGPYFDVLSGTYRIEDRGDGTCRLHLSSRQRLSTRFNPYTQLWTRFFMNDIQDHILQVIQRRCETATR